MKVVLTVVLSLFLVGCLVVDWQPTEPAREYILRIESDASWEGHIGNPPNRRFISGWGDKIFYVDRPLCWDIQMRSQYGYLRAFGTYSSYYPNSGSKFPTWADHSTTRQYSFISGCF